MLKTLTNDAKFLLSSMYIEYLNKRKSGATKKDSMFFGNVDKIHSEIMPEWLYEDVLFTCFELKRHGFIKGMQLDKNLIRISITTEAIALSEITFKDKINIVLEYAGKIKAAIPFL
ncbi:hypothetical protein [Listeria monocytogenes]|uniref:hypothetical protein n=1 Tax=Listeria monocytogenes TaxID=1639 RepID=UPI0010EC1AC6|nr:hypothetical protein [Listeria monocytogenes]EAC8464737.1 hypothetical protein [Listeria monocytogenes]